MSPSSQRLDDLVIRSRLVGDLREWRFENGELVRIYRTKDWRATMVVANAIAHIAEQSWHHPELELSYAHVKVRLTTHDLGGVSERDLALANRIETLVTWQQPTDGALEAPPASHAILSPED
jgi:pterin-4a-carbinolamine dehydratase